jgi:hypothetical protein
MSPSAWIALGGALVLALALVGVLLQRARRAEVKRRFGAEYERAVEEYGTEAAAVRELRARERNVAQLELRSLNGRQVSHVERQWLKVQAGFIENPLTAVRGANTLIKTIMHERGFRSEPFEQRLADLSVDHAHVVAHYRAARELSEPSPDSPAATEEMRLAMLHYGAIVEELLHPTAQAAAAFREARA